MFTPVNDIDMAVYSVTDNTKSEDHILKLEANEKKISRCLICKSRSLKYSEIPATKRCMYKGKPAECLTHRMYYVCNACGEKYYTDDHYFDNHVSRSFTAAFIQHAMELWLADPDASFNEVAKSLEISYSLLSEWHEDLYRIFAEKTKIDGTYALLLYSFNRPEYVRRGVVFTKESSEAKPRIVSFIENYTLDDVISLVKTLQTENRPEMKLIYYSYIPGFGDSVSSLYKETKCISVNLDTLHDDLCLLLPDGLDKNKKMDQINAIGIVYSLEDKPEDTNKVVEDFNAVIDQLISLDAGNAPRTDLLNQYRISSDEFKYFIDSDTIEEIGGAVYENPISDTIAEMTGNNQSFYAIALKILYDRKNLKEIIIKSLEELAETKKAEYMKKRLERRVRDFVGDDRGSITYGEEKENPVVELFDIFGLPEIKGYSVEV